MRLVRRSGLKRVLLAGAAMTVLGACTDLSTGTDVPLGRVTVSVTDENNAPVSQMLVQLLRPDRVTIWRSLTTNANGSGEFDPDNGGVIPQAYLVRLQLGDTWLLQEGETNDKPLTVVIGETHPITFKVRKKAPTGPGEG